MDKYFQYAFCYYDDYDGYHLLIWNCCKQRSCLIDYTNLLVQRKKLDLGIQADKPLQIEDFKNSVISGGAARLSLFYLLL